MKKRSLFFLFFVFLQFSSSTLSAQEKVTPEMINNTRALRALMHSDPHRPSWHFVSPENEAMPFDPNGGIFWNGKYHLGYIYQNLENGKRQHYWGHAVTTDLFHWTLYPDMIKGDNEIGIFSGGAFLSKEGVPHIMYHGWGSSSNLMVYSTDEDLKTWKKFEGNPILKTPVEGEPMYKKYKAFDPDGWYDKEADAYYQISAGDPAGLFKSKDMLKWDYLGDFIDQDNRMRHDFEDLACPDFYKIGDKYMLTFISHSLGAQYYIGDFKNDKFTVEKHGRMNWPGGTLFAPEEMKDDKGRHIMWSWVIHRTPKHLEYKGWHGTMSMPRVLSLSKQGELLIAPPVEVEKLRLEGISSKNISLASNQEKTLAIKGKALEIKAEFKGAQNSEYGVKVFCSPDGKEETIIKYDPINKEIVIDFIHSSKNAPVKMGSVIMGQASDLAQLGFRAKVSEQRAPFELKKGETLQLNIFIDKAIIEVFANGRQCITQVVYPEMKNSNEVKIFSGDEKIKVKSVEVWKMATTNPY